MITKREAAKALDGGEYRLEGSGRLWDEMRAARLVAVFGASDDLMEFRGAVNDEMGTGPVYFGEDGLIENKCFSDNCPYFVEKIAGAPYVEARWDAGNGYDWEYETNIPHETFTINDEGLQYCKGIVFSLDELESQV